MNKTDKEKYEMNNCENLKVKYNKCEKNRIKRDIALTFIEICT